MGSAGAGGGIFRFKHPTPPSSSIIRPSSLKPEPDERRPSQEDELIMLSRLPSPLERRQGSIIGEPQLPVPMEFSDSSKEIEEYEERDTPSPLPGSPSPLPSSRFSPSPTFGGTLSASEAALRSKLRLSNRLCSVPEEQCLRVKDSLLSDEDRRRISTTCASPRSSLHPIDVGEADKALQKKPHAGSRRLSIGALIGSSLMKMDSKSDPMGLTSGASSKIRHKTIPIINPMVKNPNWPSTTYKKGMNKDARKPRMKL